MFVLEKADLQRMIDEIEKVRKEGYYPDNMKMWICPLCLNVYLYEPKPAGLLVHSECMCDWD